MKHPNEQSFIVISAAIAILGYFVLMGMCVWILNEVAS